MNSKTKFLSIVIAGLVIVLLAFALIWRGSAVTTAPVVLPTAKTGSDSLEVYSIVGRADVKPETVQAAIATLSRTQAYTRTVTVEDFWAGGSGITVLKEWRSSGSTRIRMESENAQNILFNGDTLYIWYDNENGVYECPSDSAPATVDRWLRCLTYEDLLELPPESITDAGYTQYAGESCIWASCVSDSFGYTNTLYISVNTGLLMGCETYDGETLIYRMTSDLPDTVPPDSSWFTPPENAG